jgi:hypothetical protein
MTYTKFCLSILSDQILKLSWERVEKKIASIENDEPGSKAQLGKIPPVYELMNHGLAT